MKKIMIIAVAFMFSAAVFAQTNTQKPAEKKDAPAAQAKPAAKATDKPAAAPAAAPASKKK